MPHERWNLQSVVPALVLSCRPVTWRPQHKNKLGNEFLMYTNSQWVADHLQASSFGFMHVSLLCCCCTKNRLTAQGLQFRAGKSVQQVCATLDMSMT